MKKRRFLICALLLSSVGLINAALGHDTAKASLYCSDLVKCSGQAGCPSGGSVDAACIINCVNGGTVSCNFREDEND
jgi:hypothetical protein